MAQPAELVLDLNPCSLGSDVQCSPTVTLSCAEIIPPVEMPCLLEEMPRRGGHPISSPKVKKNGGFNVAHMMKAFGAPYENPMDVAALPTTVADFINKFTCKPQCSMLGTPMP